MLRLFEKHQEERRFNRTQEINKFSRSELEILLYENEQEISRLEEKIKVIHSFMYCKYCQYLIKELKWENDVIKLKMCI